MKIQNYKFLLLVLASLLLSVSTSWGQTVTIQQPILSTPISCFGVNDGTITITIDTADGIQAPFTYTLVRISPSVLVVPSIVSSDLTVTFTGLAPGAYVAAVQDANGIDDPSGPLASVGNRTPVNTALSGSVTNVLCFGAATGVFTVRGSGGLNINYDFQITGPSFPSGSGFIGSSTKTHTFNNLLAGTYSVVARDENGCVDPTPLSVTLTQATQISISVSSAINPLCAGNANGSISVSATGGTPGYQYSIDGVTFGNSNTFTGLTAGTYEISVQDTRGCIERLSGIVLTDPAVLAIALDSQTDIQNCFGDATGQIQVSATGGTSPYVYSINGGSFVANSGLFTGLPAGSYTITARDANNCTIALAPVTLTQPAQLTIALNSQTNVLGCFGDATGDITVVATGGQPAYEYSINGGGTFQPSTTFTGLTAGSYTILVRDSRGCTATLPNITITEPTQLDLVLGSSQNPLCNGDSNGSIAVNASGGQPGYLYSINGGAFQTSNTFSGLPAGNYNITVRDSQNCETTLASIVLNNPAILSVSIASQQDVQNCFGDSSGSITVSATGGTTGYQYSINGGATFQASATFGSLPAGSYTITVRDANNCTASISTTINQPPVLALNLASQTNILGCFGDATGSISVSATGGTPGYQYSINGGATFQASATFNGLTAGSYTITVRDSRNCTATVAVTLAQPSQVTASLASQTNILCFGSSTGTITVNATGGTGTLSYSIDGSTFGSSNSFTGLAAGSYTITIRDANGCTTTVPATLTQPTQVAGSVTAQQNIACNGGSNGTISVSATGGTAPYTFSRDGVTFVSNSGLFTGLPAGSYTITVRDANNCTATIGTVTLTEPTALQATLTSTTNVSCNGGATGSITVSASGGTVAYQYSINGGATFQASATFNGLTAGSYTITVRDANNCTTTVPATLTQPAALVLNTSTTNTTCNGTLDGTATVTASGGTSTYTYSWNTSPVQTTATATGLAAGSYTVTVTDANGCPQTATVTITQPAVVTPPTATNPAAICTGGTIPALTATGTNIQWYSDAALTTLVGSGNSFTPTISNATAGNFTFYATQTVTGCTSTATAVTITINTTPTTPTISGTLTFCAGGNTTLTSSAVSSNQWLLNGSPISGATNQTLTVSAAGNYTVQITSSGCSATSTVATVTETITPTPTISGILTFCAGSNTTLTSSASTGNQWLLNGSPIAGATNQTLVVSTAGTYSLTVTVSGCSATSATATVTQTTTPAPVAANPAAICTGGTIPTLTATGTSIQWYSDAALTTLIGSGSPFTPTISNATAGNFTFYATQTASGCTSTATAVTITINASPAKPTISGTLTFCVGGNTTLTSSAATGNQWLLNGSPISGATNQTLVVSAAGNYSVTVTSGSCSATSDPVAVTQTITPAPVAANPAAICVGAAAPQLTATGTAIEWYSDAALTTLVGTGSPFTPTVNTAVAGNTIFYVTQTVSACPSPATQVTVTVSPAPATPTISGTLTFCAGGNTILTSSAATGNQWLLNGTILTGETNQTLDVSVAGNYSVVVNPNGCAATSAAVTVTEIIIPTPTIAGSLNFCAGNSTVLTSSAATGNQWLLNGTAIAGATNQTLTVSSAGNYTVQVTSNGCSATSAVATVTQTTVPTPTIAGILSFCAGGNTILTSSAASGNQWLLNGSPISGATNQTLTVSAAGNYSLTVTASGCSATSATATVTQTNTPAPVAANPAAICTGGTIPTLTATGTSIQWYSDAALTTLVGSGNSFTPTISNATAGNFTFYATQTVTGCTSTATAVTITINTTPATPTISGTLNFCAGNSTVLTSSAATGNQWLLNGSPISGATNQTLTVSAAGNYTVQVTSSGCSATSTVATVTETITPTPTISGTLTFCAGGNTTLTSSASSGNQWLLNGSPISGATNQTLTVSAAGNYSLTVTASGCSATSATATVTQTTTPAPVAANPAPICTGGTIPALTATGTNIQWYSDAALTTLVGTGNSFTPTISNATAGNFTFYATQTASGCTSTATAVTITINALPATPTISGTLTFCAGNNTTLTSSAVSGNQWLLNGSPISGATNQTLTVTTAGNYSVTSTSAGCSATSASVTVTETIVTTPTISGTLTFCVGGNTILTSSAATGNQWLLNGAAISGATSQTLVVTAAGNYSVQITSGSCSATSAVATVTQTTVASPIAANPAAICTGGTIPTLTATGTSIQWYSDAALTTLIGSGNSFTPTISNATAGNFTFYATQTVTGCTSTATAVTITINTTPTTPTISGTLSFCAGGNTTLTSSAVSGNQWLLNGSPISGATNQTLTVSAAGNYTVQITSSGCSATSAVATVTQTTVPTPTIAGILSFCTGGNTILTSSAASGNQWLLNGSPISGATNQTLTVSAAGNYSLTVTASGCSATSATATVTQTTTPAPVAANPAAICTGAAIPALTATGANIQWYSDAALTTLVGTGNSFTPTISNATAGTFTFYATQTVSGCQSTATVVTITINASPAKPTVSGTLTFCTGGNTTLTSSAATGNQWLLNGAPISGATNQTLTVSAAGNYSVTVTSGTCSATSDPVAVSITTVSAPVAANPAMICVGGVTPTLTATGTSIQWYSDAALTTLVGSGSPFTPTVNTSVAGNTTFYVTQTVSACPSPATQVTVTVSPAPATPTISGTLTFCAGGNTILTSSAATGNQWLLNGTILTGETNQTLDVSVAGNYSVQVGSGSCVATSAIATVVSSTVAVSLTAVDPGCSNPNSGVLTISASGGTAPYRYSLDGVNFANTSGVFGALSAGTYTIYARDATGCTITRTQTLNAISGITAVAVNPVNETACSAADGTITVTGITGGTAPYEYYINGVANPAGINSNVFSALTPGSYSIRITSANGCEFTTTSIVGTDCITCTLTATISSQTNPTCAGSDGSISISAANGSGTIRYSIDGGTNFTTSPTFTGLTAGSYTIVVEDANNCIVTAGTVTLSPAVAISATVSGSNPSTCGVNDGTITVSNVTGGAGSYQYSLDGVNYQTSATFTGLAGNSYTVSIRDANSCVVTYTQVITAPNGISSVTVNTTSESGCATVDGAITVTATGGSTPYRYYINGVANPAGINNNIFAGLAGGTYSIRVETANNCFFTTTAFVGTNCPVSCTLVATTSVTDILCNNGSNGQLIVSASGGTGLYEYSLDGTTFQNTAVFSNLTPGIYTVTTRDKNSPACEVTNTVTLTNPPAITGSVTATTNPSCQNNDGSIIITASGGTGTLQYALNGGAFTNLTTFTGLASGNYTITARDANGCTITVGTATLTLPTAITATTSPVAPSTCSASDGQIIVSNVQNGLAPYQYSINGGAFQASATFTGLAEGSYVIQVRDAAGCVANLNPVVLRVNVTILATLSSTNPTSCTLFDGTITSSTPTGGTAPYEYSIDGITFQSSNTFTNLAQNNYTVTIRDANGCTQTLPVTLTAPNSITAVNASATAETTCNASDGQITVTSVTGGTAPYQYFINGAPNPAGVNNPAFTGLAGGTYSIRVVTADGCEFITASTVQVACCLQASVASQTNPTCQGNNGSIVLTATGGNGSVQYSIDGGVTFSATASFTGLPAGTYAIIVRDGVCQRTVPSITLTTVPLTATLVGTDPSGCSATNGQITISNVTGGAAPYQYSIDGVTYVSTATFTNLSSGSYTLFVREASGCIISINQTLASTGGILSVNTTTTSESGCSTRDGSITVTNVVGIAGPYQYYIDGVLNPAGANNATMSGLSAGPHTVRVVAPNTCDFTVSVIVGSNCPTTCTLTASINSQVNPTCAGNDGTLSITAINGTGTLQYSIDGGNTFVTTNVFSNLTAGNYTIIVRDAAACQVSVSATLTLPATITATIMGTNPTGCNRSDGQIVITNAAGGVGPYRYSINGITYQSDSLISSLTNGSYTIYIRDNNGCIASFSQTLSSPGGITAITTATTDETVCAANDGAITVTNVTDGTAPFRYFIDGLGNPAGINNNVFTALSPGSYSIRVIDSNGCRYTTVVSVNAADCNNICQLTASMSYRDPDCSSTTSGAITVTPANGTAPYVYSINGTAFVTGTGNFTNLAVNTYTVIVRDANGCTFTLPSIQMLPPQGPNDLNTVVTNPSGCATNDARIIISSVAGGTVPYLYSIDGINFDAASQFDNLSAGTYTVYVRDAKMCIYSETVSLTAPAGIAATIAVTNETTCAANDGTATVTVNGATGSVEYYIGGVANPAGINNNVFTGLNPGIYTIRVTDAAGCQFTTTATITAFTCPGCTLTASANSIQPGCTNPNSGSITVTATNGTAPFEYSIDGGTTFVSTNVFSNLAAGNYTIIVRDAAACQVSVSATLTLPATITATVSKTDVTNCTASDGSISVSNTSGGTAPYQYSINGTTYQSGASFTSLTAGSYTVFVRDASNCVVTFSQTIAAPGGISATIAAVNESACAASDGQVSVNVTGATGAIEYYINGVANPAGINNNVFTTLAPATYTIRVTDAAGCQFTTTATITAFTCPGCTLTAAASVSQPTCTNPTGGSITVTTANGTGTLQYSIDGGTTFVTTNVFSNLAAGNYTIIVRDAAACQVSVSATLTLPAAITATIAATNATNCTVGDGSITISNVAGGNGVYQYSLDNITYQAAGSFTNLTAGTYTVFIRDNAGCSATFTQTITAPSGITATFNATNETACTANDGQVTVSVSGATGAVEYYINGAANPAGINSNIFTTLAPGTYTIRVTDAAGCQFTSSITITAFTCSTCTLSASSTVTQPTCASLTSGSITVTPVNGTAPYSYSVNGAAFATGNGQFNGLAAGTYAIIVRDANACEFTLASITLTNPTVTLTVSGTNPTSCGTDDATITINAAGGSGTYTYSLDGTNFIASNVFTGLPAGSYLAYVQDAAGCIVNQSITLASPSGITSITATPTSETGCGLLNGTITVTGVTGGTTPYQYYINGVANPAGINNNVFSSLAPATYTIRVVAANGCEFVSSTTVGTVCITCQLTATITSTNPTSCTATDGTITVTGETNGLAPYQYSIDGITFQSSNTFTNLADGNYTVIVRDANNCTTSQLVVITAPVGFTATLATTNETACRANNGRITVTVNGGVAPYKYYINGIENVGGNLFTALTPGTYTLRVTDASNCEYTAVATVQTFTCPPPTCTLTASAFTNPVLCNGVNDGEAILINVSGGSGSYEYSIDNGVTYQSNPQFTSLGAGNYSIFVRDRNNLTCVASFPVTVATKFNVAGIIIVNQPKSCGDKGTITFTNVFGGQAPYQFSVNGTTFVSDTLFSNLDPGTYKATIRDSNGCQFSASIQVIGGAAITATVAQGQQASCGRSDGSIVITNAAGGSGVFVYSLDGTTFSGSTTFGNLAAGSYTVYIKEQNGSCVATFPVNVTAADCCKLAITPTVSQPTTCSSTDGQITINATDGVAPLTYRLNNGATQNSNVFGGLGNGVYTIVVTDANNCTATITATLTSPNAVTAQTEQVIPASCFGKADGAARLINVSGGSGNYEYSIDGIIYQSAPLFTGLKANTYLLYVRDRVSSCVASYPVTISEATQITATVTPTNPSACNINDGRIVISNIAGGVGPYQVSMDSLLNYQSTLQFSNLGNGTYKIYVKDSRGCLAVYSLRVSSPNAVTAGNPTLINPTCQGSNNGEIRMITVTGGQAPYQYNIDGGAYQTSGTFTALSAGKHIINVRDQSGCEYPFEYTLTEPATITFDVKQTKEATCTDPLGAVEVQNPSGGITPYRYSLNNVDFQTSPIFDNLSPGDYVMYVRDASRNTCASTKPFTIRGSRRVSYSVTTANIGCSGTEKGSIAIHNIVGGIESGSPVEYGISINGGTSFKYISSDSTIFENLEAGLYDIVIEYGSGCKTDPQRVIIDAGSIPFTVNTSAATCGTNNGSAEVVITNPIPGKTYYYSMDSLNFFTTPNFPNLYSGTYKMYIRESLTDVCPNIKAFTVPGPDSVRYVIRRQDCNTVIVDSIRGGVAPYVITISGRRSIVTGGIFANRYVLTELPDGDYSMTIEDNAGCSTLPYNFRVGNRIIYKVKTSPSVIEEPTGSVTVYDITGGQPPYEVSVDGQNWSVIRDKSIPIDTTVTGLPLGPLNVYVRDANGCRIVQPAVITELKFVVPNIFTPNGDGVNDTFFITKLPAGTFVKIIDRWGRVVFETRDYKNEWDGGTYPDGVYYYTIDIAGEQTYKGWVQIWR